MYAHFTSRIVTFILLRRFQIENDKFHARIAIKAGEPGETTFIVRELSWMVVASLNKQAYAP